MTSNLSSESSSDSAILIGSLGADLVADDDFDFGKALRGAAVMFERCFAVSALT